jgi:hypothetical protein
MIFLLTIGAIFRGIGCGLIYRDVVIVICHSLFVAGLITMIFCATSPYTLAVTYGKSAIKYTPLNIAIISNYFITTRRSPILDIPNYWGLLARLVFHLDSHVAR